MVSRGASVVTVILALIPLALTGILYSRLPAVMAGHWSITGEVDGYSSRAWVAFTVPIMLLVVRAVFWILPRIAPAHITSDAGGRYVDEFLIVLFVFFNLLHAQMLMWNLGTEISFSVTLPIGVGFLFIFIGRLLGHVEPNWMVGIRTYWTLKNPVVWMRTHERAALLFKILGVIIMGAAFFRGYGLIFILLPAVFLALYLPAYSFLLYQKIEKAREGSAGSTDHSKL